MPDPNKGHDISKAPEPDPTVHEMFARQQPLLDARDRIAQYAVAAGITGFVQSAVDIENDRLTIFWHGPIPHSVTEFAQISSQGVNITLKEVPFSLEDLEDEAQRILGAYPYVVGAGPARDFTGLIVRVDFDQLASEPVQIVSEIPVQIEAGKSYIPLSRPSDSPSFWAGSIIVNEDGGVRQASRLHGWTREPMTVLLPRFTVLRPD